MNHSVWLAFVVVVCCASLGLAGEPVKKSALQMALENTQPLKFAQGDRPPLVFWTPNLVTGANDADLEKTLADLKARGIGLLHRWSADVEKGPGPWIRVGKFQKKLAMPVIVDGTGIAHGFYPGDEKLGHVDKDGKRFRDKSFFWSPGCPFTLKDRITEKRKPYEAWCQKYKDAGLTVDYWMADFEFDGPNEWNDGWAAAKNCTVCREKIPAIDTDFAAFQKAVREIRTQIQRETWVEPLKAAFPAIRIGNYGMNSHDGFRYYKDFYEKFDMNLPHKMEQKAVYRPWAKEFDNSGYTLAMPVVYTWGWIFDSCTFPNKQYRWFYNMLLEATSVAKSRAPETTVMPFMHWSTTDPPKDLPAGFEPMSRETYEELLWHMLLRGFDGFVMWSPDAETAVEVQPVHAVYAASLEYRDFLAKGKPAVFDLPSEPGTVISALQLGNKLLVRRTDFGGSKDPVQIKIAGKNVAIPANPGTCFIVNLP